MKKPKLLKVGDTIAVVSLSSGILGEPSCEHQVKLTIERLRSYGLNVVFMPNALRGFDFVKNNPKARASDLKEAFLDDSIKGIIAAIGGEDTFTTLPFLLEDESFVEAVRKNPKIFMGFSDTTVNHLMFQKLGIVSYYGLSIMTDIAELGNSMLPYTDLSFRKLFNNEPSFAIESSDVWYEERSDFSENALGTNRIEHPEKRHHEILNPVDYVVKGTLIGGCFESIHDLIAGEFFAEQRVVADRYNLLSLPWTDRIVFLETSELRISAQTFENYLNDLIDYGLFEGVKAVVFGKPQNELYYDEYKSVLKKTMKIPVLLNMNFGHAYPRTILPYGLMAELNCDEKSLTIVEPFFDID